MTDPTATAAPKVTITWTLRDYYKSTWDLSDPKQVADLASILRVDREYEGEALVRAVADAARQVEDDPEYEVAEAFAEVSSRNTWFDRDPGDCVRITDVEVE